MGEVAEDRRLARDRGVVRVLWIVLGWNVAVAMVKLLLGNKTGALSLLADGLHAVLDASSNVVGLVGIAIARRPADAGHPYGHRRFETLAALSIGVLILGGMAAILQGLWQGIRGHRAPPEVTIASAGIVLATVIVNFLVSRYESRRGLDLKSNLLAADAAHTLSDTLGAVVVLLGFAATALGVGFADTVAAAVVAILIGRTAWEVLSANVGVLADSARLDPHKVRRVAMLVSEVRGAHKIRSRGSADHVQVDLHIHVDPSMTVQRAHDVTHEVATAVRSAFPEVADVMIHTEPADGRENDESAVAPSDAHLQAPRH